MSSLERSPSPLLLHKQTSELLPDERSPPSSQLTVPMQLGSNSASPSPQMKHKKITAVTEGVCLFLCVCTCVWVCVCVYVCELATVYTVGRFAIHIYNQGYIIETKSIKTVY